MLAISIKQPWAHLIEKGLKREEYRSRPTRHRGDLLVVASQAIALDADIGLGGQAIASLPRGVSICVVRVTGCEKRRNGYAWRLEEPRPVERVPVRGSAAFYHVPDDRIVFAAPSDRPISDRVLRTMMGDGVDRVASVVARDHRRTPRGPYSLHFRGRTIDRGIATPAEARERAKARATELGDYVRIHRDGFEISGAYP